jgi:hypothetical protein
MIRLAHPDDPKTERTAEQPEFPLRVAVCAWCKPRELGATVGALSHGICPRHLREVKLKLQNSPRGGEGAPVRPQAGRSRRLSKSLQDLAQLSFAFPVVFGDAAPFSA